MATRQQIEQWLENANVRKMLNLVAATEGVKHGYNTLFGNQRIDNLNAHPNIKKSFRQTDGKTNYTTAAGRYQFLNKTWNGLARQYGFRDFGARNQDLGAVALIAQRGAINDVINGNWQGAIKKLGPEWASLPTSRYAQNKRGWDFVNKHLGSNITNLPQQKSQQGLKPTTRFLSSDQISKVLPQLAKENSQPQRFLSQYQINKVLPQLNPKQTPVQNERFLSSDQISKVLPQLINRQT